MGLKHIKLLVLFFSCSFAFSQSDMINSLNTNSEKNVDYPLTSQELSFIENAYDDETLTANSIIDENSQQLAI